MAKSTINQRNKLFKKLKSINITTEKDIANIKVSELKKINDIEGGEKLSIKDIELLWAMQEAIDNKKFIDFIINNE